MDNIQENILNQISETNKNLEALIGLNSVSADKLEDVSDAFKGIDKIKGLDGRDGKNGKDGKQGLKGEKGAKGDKGDPGKDGKNGFNGKDGKNGLPGAKGKNGIDGKDGKDGLDGLDGSPDTGIEIVEKINKIPNGSTYRIEAIHISGLEYLPMFSGLNVKRPVSSATDVSGLGVINKLTYWNGTNTISYLDTATYPSLTEISYVKGVTSAIQTQLNGKQASMGADDNYVTDAQLVVIQNTSGTNTGDNSVNTLYSGLAASKADVGQTFFIGTTQVAINRASAALTLAGITLTTPDIGVATATSLNIGATTSSTTGIIFKGTDRFIHDYAPAGSTGNNTFVGLLSGNFTATYASGDDSSRNTGVGYSTLTSLTTGNYNTAVGWDAGDSITTGIYNNLIGANCGQSIVDGNSNNMQGLGAGSALTSGNRNVVLGESGMRYNETGSDNTAVGYRSLFSTAGTNYSNAIAIGAYSGKYETAPTNKLFIDGLDRTTEALGRTNSLIYGVMSATATSQILVLGGGGNVGIGTTNPQSKLWIEDLTASPSLTINTLGTAYVPTVYLRADHTSGSKFQYSGTLNFNGYNTGTSSWGDRMTLLGNGNVGIGTAPTLAKFQVAGATLTQKLVEANTAGVASPNIITLDESSTIYTNEGATALNYHTLPTAAAGLTFTFYVDDADGIIITAGASDLIQINGVVSSAAGTATSTTIGSSITLTAINAVDWVATSVVGTWALA
jgi:hypothetical protein